MRLKAKPNKRDSKHELCHAHVAHSFCTVLQETNDAAHLRTGSHCKGDRMALQVGSNLSVAVDAAAQKETGRVEGVARTDDHRCYKSDVNGSLCSSRNGQDPGCALLTACLIRAACKPLHAGVTKGTKHMRNRVRGVALMAAALPRP